LRQLDHVHRRGLYRRVPHDRHPNEPSSFQIGVSRGRRIAWSGRLAHVLHRLHSTSSQPSPLRHCPIVGDGCTRAAEAFHSDRPRMSLRTIGLTRGFYGALTRALGVHLRRADLSAPNYLSGFCAHWGDHGKNLPVSGNSFPLERSTNAWQCHYG
jgi:hypothetical protein